MISFRRGTSGSWLWLRRWVLVIAPILVAAQFALLAHQFEHNVTGDSALPAHECLYCGFATFMDAGAPPSALPVPSGISTKERLIPRQEPCQRFTARHFCSRAPPAAAAF